MKIRILIMISAVAAILAGATPGNAMVGKPINPSSDVILARDGHGHGFAHGNRGRHRGWYMGRHLGWSHSHHRMH